MITRVLLRWLLAVLFISAALSKLANPQDFSAALETYKLPAPEVMLKLVAIILPWLELLCGLMLVANFHVEAALAWAIGLFALFALMTGQAWARGLNISCGCLKLDFLGQGLGSVGAFLESAAFACLRSLVLCGVAIYLLKKTHSEVQRKITVANDKESSKAPGTFTAR